VSLIILAKKTQKIVLFNSKKKFNLKPIHADLSDIAGQNGTPVRRERAPKREKERKKSDDFILLRD
jgi:hypothetical protein